MAIIFEFFLFHIDAVTPFNYVFGFVDLCWRKCILSHVVYLIPRCIDSLEISESVHDTIHKVMVLDTYIK